MPVIIVKHSGGERLDKEEGRYRAADNSRVLIALNYLAELVSINDLVSLLSFDGFVVI